MAKNKGKTKDWLGIKWKLEQRRDIQTYNNWLELPESVKDGIRLEWMRYYDLCHKSDSAKLYRLMNKAYKNNSRLLIHRITKMAIVIRERRQWLPQPTDVDPFDYENAPLYLFYRRTLDEVAGQQRDDPEAERESIFYG